MEMCFNFNLLPFYKTDEKGGNVQKSIKELSIIKRPYAQNIFEAGIFLNALYLFFLSSYVRDGLFRKLYSVIFIHSLPGGTKFNALLVVKGRPGSKFSGGRALIWGNCELS